ncbi:hypothetical protein ACP4OV_030963 [Aristida adscensionis]
MIFPASAFLDSSSLEESRHQLHQQAASYYKDDYAIVTPCVGGGHQGNNNNLHNQQGSAMGAAGPEGGGGQCLMRMSERARTMARPEAGVACPRCDSTNTKFCYFNNYSLSQPRHFCRACRRYWTRGGALRNVPVRRRHAKPTTEPSPAPAAACTTMLDRQQRLANIILPPPPATAALSCCSFPAPAGMAAEQQQQWISSRVQSRLHSFPFLHALPLDHHIMGPPGPPTGIQTMFHLGLQSAGVMSSQQDGREFRAVKTDEDQHEYAVRATSNTGDATSYYSAGNL